MAWAIITIYISKCAQMNPQQLPKTSKFYSKCKKCDIEKTLGEWVPPPLVARRLSARSTQRIVSRHNEIRGLHLLRNIFNITINGIQIQYPCRPNHLLTNWNKRLLIRALSLRSVFHDLINYHALTRLA